jgi:hypothetical protein
MNVRINSDLAFIFASSLYALYKEEIYSFIKKIEYMPITEFEKEFSNKEYFKIKNYRIYFAQVGHDVLLKAIEPSL